MPNFISSDEESEEENNEREENVKEPLLVSIKNFFYK